MTRARDVANLIGSGNYSSTTFTATAGQTAFTISHTQGFIQVFMNGLLLDETADYTSNGSAVTLTSGAAAGDEIEVVAYNTFSVGDALNQAAADTRYVNASGDTMTGDLTIDTNTFHVDVADNRVGIGTAAPTNNLTIVDGGATPYGADATLLLDMKRNTTNSGATNAVGLRLANNSNGFSVKYGGASDTLNISGGSGNATATFRNDGGMTLPYQPMFDAYLSANVTHPSGNYNMSTGDSWATRTNVGSHFSSGTFTAPVAGKYLFCAAINGGHPIGAMTYFSCEFEVNGGRRHIHWFGKGGSSSSYIAANNTAVISLAANDYVRLTTEKSHGCTVIGQGPYTHFGGILIG